MIPNFPVARIDLGIQTNKVLGQTWMLLLNIKLFDPSSRQIAMACGEDHKDVKENKSKSMDLKEGEVIVGASLGL